MINMVMARGLVQFSIIVIIELWKKDPLLDEYMYFFVCWSITPAGI